MTIIVSLSLSTFGGSEGGGGPARLIISEDSTVFPFKATPASSMLSCAKPLGIHCSLSTLITCICSS